MVTDENGHPVDCLEIDVELRDKMVSHIHNRIISNLEAIKKFLQIPGYVNICAGVYTYAVEEYGKSLYLKSFCLSPADSNKIKFPYKMKGKKKGNTGFLNHYKKFELALNVLPDACKTLSEGGFTSSGFTSTGFITGLIADLGEKESIFCRLYTGQKFY